MCSQCGGDYEDPEMTTEPDELSDVLGTDLLQAYLAAAYAQYIHNSTVNLVGHLYQSSPLVGKRRIA